MSGDHESVEVQRIPACDLGAAHGPAYADARVPGGPWGNLCRSCFDLLGCRLGLGHGQRLIQADA